MFTEEGMTIGNDYPAHTVFCPDVLTDWHSGNCCCLTSCWNVYMWQWVEWLGAEVAPEGVQQHGCLFFGFAACELSAQICQEALLL